MNDAVEPSAPQTPESLVRMANQIAAHTDHKPYDVAVDLVATHLREFWPPSMRSHLIEYVDAGGSGLSPVALAALDRLR